jgi:hypothetical protein
MVAKSLDKVEQFVTNFWMNKKIDQDSPSSKLANDADSENIQEFDKRGLALYSELLSIGHHDVMLSIYPYCAELLGKKWRSVVSQYLQECPPDHYNLNRTASRFPEFLATFQQEPKSKYPYLLELADYEWVEMELLEKDVKAQPCSRVLLQSPEDFQSYYPVVNPALAIKHYTYPIPKIIDWLNSDHRSAKRFKPADTHMIIYRHPQSHGCKFLEVGEISAALIQVAANSKRSYADLIALAISLAGHNAPEQTVNDVLELIERLQDLQLFLGSEKLQK